MPDVNRRYRDLFGPVDAAELTLPSAVVEARATLAPVTAAAGSLQAPEAAEVAFNAAVTATLTADDPSAVDLAGVLGHDERRREHDARVAVIRTAIDRADQAVRDAVADTAEEIVVEHIRPAGEELWKRIKAAAAVLAGVGHVTAEAMLRASKRQQDAYLGLAELALAYDRLRGALSTLPFEDQRIEYDIQADHAEFRDGMCRVVGELWRGTSTSGMPRQPWDGRDGRGRLVWTVENGHEPWWPLPRERDAAWLAVHQEAADRAAEQQRRHKAVHARIEVG